jgi:hypothetical protein
MGFTKDDLKSYQSNPFGFVSAYTNTMQGKGYSQEQILHNLEDLADDLGLYHKAFSNQGKAITDQVDVLKRNGQWLDEAQQDQLVPTVSLTRSLAFSPIARSWHSSKDLCQRLTLKPCESLRKLCRRRYPSLKV